MHGGWLDFELPLVEVEKRIADLRSVGGPDAARNEQELRDLERKGSACKWPVTPADPIRSTTPSSC